MTEASVTEAGATPVRKDRSLLWWVLSLLLGFFVLAYNTEVFLRAAHIQPGGGEIGIRYDVLDSDTPPGFVRVGIVIAGSPAERAGIRVGDFTRFPQSGAIIRRVTDGEAIPIIHERDGVRTPLTLVADPRPFGIEHFEWGLALGILALTVSALFGLLIVGRSRGKTSALWLGVALIVFGQSSVWPTLWTSAIPLFWIVTALLWMNYALLPIAFLQFAMHFYKENVRPVSTRTRVIFLTLAAGCVAATVLVLYAHAISAALPVVGAGIELQSFIVYAGLFAAAWMLFVGWRRSSREVQQRYAIMLVGVALILLSQVLQTTTSFLFGGPGISEGIWVDIGNWLAGVFAPGLLAYAILRHRVFDLSFAVNRTLIFSIVSAILLLAFGLAEWIVNERLGIAALRDNPFVAAAIALVLFLTFHNIHGAVERVVEAIFFRTWRRKEAALRRFVREAGFVLKGDVLERDFITALRGFADGAEAALYERDENGAYERVEGAVKGAPELIDADEPALVALRADLATVELVDTRSPLPAALALPMVIRHEIDGFVLLASKPSGLAYRPDEKEELAKATEAIGDDLHALKVEQLQRGIANLEARNDELRSALSGALAPKPA